MQEKTEMQGTAETEATEETKTPKTTEEINSPQTESEETKTNEDLEKAIEDFERMANEDLSEIKRLFPSFSELSHVRELDRAERFGEMREAGFSVEEALLATNYERIFETIVKKARSINGKSHLVSRVPTSSGGDARGMTSEEMRNAKEMFSGLSEREIQSLYKRAIS